MSPMKVYEARKRLAKVITLETYIRTHLPDVTLDHLRAADLATRNEIAVRAGCARPSKETWRILCLLFAGEQLPEEYR